jgi:hypothetical protein
MRRLALPVMPTFAPPPATITTMRTGRALGAPWAAIVLAVLGALPSAATVADDLCAATADPCIVSQVILATPNSVIDVGQRELQILGSGGIQVRSGGLTLRGRRIATFASALLRTSGSTRSDPAAPLIIEADDVALSGEIDVRGSPAGAVDITATTAILLSGRLRGRPEASSESASSVTLDAPTVVLAAAVELDGGSDDFGGDLTVAGDSITVTGSIDVRGGDGGTVDLTANESMVVTAAASIAADATTTSGSGGEISLQSDGVLEVAGLLSANGRNGLVDGGGDGGSISLGGDERVSLPATTGLVQALGGAPDGSGGDIEVVSLFGPIDIRGSVNASGDTSNSLGGTVDVSADTTFDLSGSLAARGAGGGGGAIEVEAGGAAVIHGTAVIDASTTRNAVAGNVLVTATTFIEVQGQILANSAQSSGGTGGSISLDACAVTVATAAELRCRGPRGINSITAAGAIVVRGTLSSGPAEGVNELRFPTEGPQPVTAGASIAPAATLIADPVVIPCVPLPATPTPTPSATPTHTPPQPQTATPTSTQPAPACPGDCDGNGIVSIAELVRAVNIALENDDVANCRAADVNGDGRVSINELIQAVNSALLQCRT